MEILISKSSVFYLCFFLIFSEKVFVINHSVIIYVSKIKNEYAHYIMDFFFKFIFATHNNFQLPFIGFQSDNYQSDFPSAKYLTLYRITDCNTNFLKCFKCNFCSYSTNLISDMRKHSFVHSDKRRHKCEACKQTFARPDRLKRHLLKHTGEKAYSCIVCNISFSHAYKLKLHMNYNHM